MSNVFHTGGKQGAGVNNQTSILSDLQKLEKDLMSQRSQVTNQAEVQMIDAALEEVKTAQESVSEQVSSSQTRVAAFRDEVPEVEGMALQPGQKFKTYNDHIDYMKSNLNGLNSLLMKK